MKDKEERIKQPIIKLEVNVAEVGSVLEAFAKNRLHALETFTSDIRQSVSHTINQLLHAEMSLFLGANEQQDNKRNGYRMREYALKGLGTLQLRFPRDRAGKFESIVLPTSERIDPRLRSDLALLHLAGLSNRTLALMSNRLLGIEVSKDTVSSSLATIQPAAEAWLTRPLTEKYWALYVDGTNFKIQRRGSTEKEPTLVVLGINENGYRSVLAIEPGTKDNAECWRTVFAELKRRGLDVEAVRVGIMDGLPGLERVFVEEFPKAVTARCWVHASRNALAKPKFQG